jgi:glycine/D-amino acid oxidase-like deaminating enzyme
MITLLAGAAIAYALWRVGDVLERQRHDAAIEQMLATFGPAAATVQQDPRQLLVWYPLAQTSRKLFPEAFKALDQASGGAFPFTKQQLQAAHARCSSDWLSWERAHDAEFAVKTAEVQDEIDRVPGQATPLLRTRLAAIEQQKLERYQQRYEEYIKTAKALAAFVD